jgi:uncharacterized protein YndB with AHSA1/START domain
MFDLLEELAAIHRSVARDDATDTVSVTVARTYDAERDDVWDALTNPERLPRWFYPITGDLRPGGTFQLEGNAGGDIRRCDRPTALQVTFGAPDSVLDVRLADSGDGTTLELVHTVPIAMAGSRKRRRCPLRRPRLGRCAARARSQLARRVRRQPARGGQLPRGDRVQPRLDRAVDRGRRVVGDGHGRGDRGRTPGRRRPVPRGSFLS